MHRAGGPPRGAWTAGRSRAMRTAMMAMTTSSSISVKPRGEPRGMARSRSRETTWANTRPSTIPWGCRVFQPNSFVEAGGHESPRTERSSPRGGRDNLLSRSRSDKGSAQGGSRAAGGAPPGPPVAARPGQQVVRATPRSRSSGPHRDPNVAVEASFGGRLHRATRRLIASPWPPRTVPAIPSVVPATAKSTPGPSPGRTRGRSPRCRGRRSTRSP